MSPWAFKRQVIIFTILILIITLFVFLLIPEQKPSCFDGIQNQEELGVDCGTVCGSVCREEVKDIRILWTRVVPDGNTYDVFSYIQNTNKHLIARDVNYIFTFYNNEGLPVGRKTGTIEFLPPFSQIVVLEENIKIENGIPVSAFLEFNKDRNGNELINWVYNNSGYDPKSIQIQNEKILKEELKVEAVARNTTINEIQNVTFYATIIDENDNAITSTRTYRPIIPARSEEQLTFLWRNPFIGSAKKCSEPVDVLVTLLNASELFSANAVKETKKFIDGNLITSLPTTDGPVLYSNIDELLNSLKRIRDGEETIDSQKSPFLSQEKANKRSVHFIYGTKEYAERLKENIDVIVPAEEGDPTYIFAFDREYVNQTQNIETLGNNLYFVKSGGPIEIQNVYNQTKSFDCEARPTRVEVIAVPGL